MIKSKTIKIGLLCFGIIVSGYEIGFSSLLKGTLVATPKGLIPVEKLKEGDKVWSCNMDDSDLDGKMIPVKITEISKHYTDSVFVMHLSKDRLIVSSPQQRFFTLNADVGQVFDISAMQFAKAQNIKKGEMLIDVNLVCYQINEASRYDLYTEETQGISVEVYAIEIEAPHIFFISASSHMPVYERFVMRKNPREEYSHLIGFNTRKPKHTKKHCLIMTHNGIPALGFGITLAFGSTPASISFVEAVASVGGLAISFGVAGLTVGCLTGVGLLGYKFFYKSKHKEKPKVYENKIYIECADRETCDGGGGGRDPKDPKDKKTAVDKECMYKNITNPGSRYSNTETNLTRQQFENNLQDDGWQKSVTKDGKANIYEKNGTQYVVRDYAKSTDGPTADYYAPGSNRINTKIRLIKE